MEQEAIDTLGRPSNVEHHKVLALTSLAISMKRIADVVAGDTNRMDLTNGIMHAIEQGILSASQRG